MKTFSLFKTATLALALSGSIAFAQDTAANVSGPAPQPDHVVYLAKLPAAADLVKSAGTQGVTISRIDQTADSLVVSYQYSDGRTSTFAYRLLSAAGQDTSGPIGLVSSGVAGAPDRVVYVTPQPSTTVVYADPGSVYYSRAYYDPAWDVFAPLAVGFGIGWFSHGGFWHGGWRGGWHGGGRIGGHH